jgi:imidazolonepropionase-like amidohydrolase
MNAPYKIFHGLILASIFLFLCACQSPAPTPSPTKTTVSITELPQGTTIIRNGTIIDGRSPNPIPSGLIAFQDGLIIAVGPENAFQFPTQTQIIDAQGGAILPGIIDTHSHILENSGSLQKSLRTWLESGVTSIRDLASRYGTVDVPSLHIHTIQDRLARFGSQAPTMQIAGPIITAPGGYPTQSFPIGALEVVDVGSARLATQPLIDQGAGVIKIAVESGSPANPMPTLTLAQVRAITEVAHEHGLRVTAHANRVQDARIAVDGGVDELAHSIPFGHLPDALIKQMVEQDVAILPTLLALDLSLSRLEFSAEQEQRLNEQWQDNVRRYKAAGGQIALGSDYGVQGVPAGMPVDEMALMVDFGLTTMEVIQASTSTAAAMLGREDQLGTLEAGKQADIIVVDGDPLADIQSMANVIVVIKNGQPILLP